MSNSNKPKGIEVKLSHKSEINPNAKRITLQGYSFSLCIANLEEVNATKTEVYKQIAKETGTKLSDWSSTTFSLANHYDDRLKLNVPKPVGKVPTWTEPLKVCLWYDVQKTLSSKTMTRSSAIRWLSTQPEWKGQSHKSLISAYERYVKKANWFHFAEQVGWKEFGNIHSSLVELSTRRKSLKEIAKLDKDFKDSFVLKNL